MELDHTDYLNMTGNKGIKSIILGAKIGIKENKKRGTEGKVTDE
jgi:hypothetical protein